LHREVPGNMSCPTPGFEQKYLMTERSAHRMWRAFFDRFQITKDCVAKLRLGRTYRLPKIREVELTI
jgi:hypothetical protein